MISARGKRNTASPSVWNTVVSVLHIITHQSVKEWCNTVLSGLYRFCAVVVRQLAFRITRSELVYAIANHASKKGSRRKGEEQHFNFNN